MAIGFSNLDLTAPIKTAEVHQVHPGDIYYDAEHNLSRHYDDDHNISDLVAGYKERGKILQPVRLVKVKLDGGAERLEIVCGTRRVRAAQIYVKECPDFRVPAIIVSDRALTAAERLLINIEENNNREDPSPVDKAFAMLALKEQHGYTVQQIAEVYRCSANNVRNHLKLTEVDAKILRRVHEGKLPYMDAIGLSKVDYAEKVNKALNAVDAAHADAPVVTEEKPDGAPVVKTAKPKKPGKGKASKAAQKAVKAAIRENGKKPSRSLAEIRTYLGTFRDGRAPAILKWINGEIDDDAFYNAVLAGK